MTPLYTLQEIEELIVGEVERFFPTVHILRSGFPMCGFSLKLPGDWPKGHVWVSLLDPDVRTEATCKDCLREHSALRPS